MAVLVGAYRQSGLSLKEFARERGIRPGRLHYWLYQKNRDARPRLLAKKPPACRTAVFKEVKLPSRPEWDGRWAAEVGLSEGIVVRFSASASAEWIGSVVQALKRPC
jgi:hypothetical protein